MTVDDTQEGTESTVDVDTIDVADDPDESRTVAVAATISASEKVSTGDYENYSPHESIRVAFRPALDLSDADHRDTLRQRIGALHAEVRQNIRDAVDQRLSHVPETADWPGDDRGDTDTDADATNTDD